MPETDESKRPATIGEMLFGQMILFIFCVGLPAIFTAAAPLTVTDLNRENGSIVARVSKRLLFVVPYQHVTVRDVVSLGDRAVEGSTGVTRGPAGGSRRTQLEDSAYLLIEGANASAEVEISPANIQRVREKAGAFLSDPTHRHLRLVTVANWKFGVIAGGFLSLLTVFYAYLQAGSLIQLVTRKSASVRDIVTPQTPRV